MLKVQKTAIVNMKAGWLVDSFLRAKRDHKVKDGDLDTLMVIAAGGWKKKNSNGHHLCKFNITEIADAQGKSKKSVQRSVTRLKEAGLIDIVYRQKHHQKGYVQSTKFYKNATQLGAWFRLKTKDLGVKHAKKTSKKTKKTP